MDYCVGRDTDSQQSRQNCIFLPGEERSGYFCHRKGGQRAEEGRRVRGEPSLPTLPLGEAPSPPAPALRPTEAQEHGGKPRCRTSDSPGRLQSLSAASTHVLLLLMLCFAFTSSQPLLKHTSTDSSGLGQCPPARECVPPGHRQTLLWKQRSCCCPCSLNLCF